MILFNNIAILEHDTHLSKWVKEHKRLDFDQNALPSVLPFIKEGDVIIDAGANIGCYGIAFINKAGQNGMLHAFEPSKESFECLEHNLGKFDNVELYNSALSYKKGYCEVIRENDNVGMNYVKETNKTEATRVTTIDSLALNKVDFIKIDVEGDELNVLIGAYQTITKCKPTMYIEINEHTLRRKNLNKLDIFNWLEKNGYTYKNIYDGQGFNDEQFDIIAIHNEKL
jgi:FkbM family methyltransferase